MNANELRIPLTELYKNMLLSQTAYVLEHLDSNKQRKLFSEHITFIMDIRTNNLQAIKAFLRHKHNHSQNKTDVFMDLSNRVYLERLAYRMALDIVNSLLVRFPTER